MSSSSPSIDLAQQTRDDFARWLTTRMRDAEERFVRELDVDDLSLRQRVTLMQVLAADDFRVSLVRYASGSLANVFWVERSIKA
jgi:hypothetical protein